MLKQESTFHVILFGLDNTSSSIIYASYGIQSTELHLFSNSLQCYLLPQIKILKNNLAF